jgi:hypothetical protein
MLCLAAISPGDPTNAALLQSLQEASTNTALPQSLQEDSTNVALLQSLQEDSTNAALLQSLQEDSTNTLQALHYNNIGPLSNTLFPAALGGSHSSVVRKLLQSDKSLVSISSIVI